jgi:hypothetical protein
MGWLSTGFTPSAAAWNRTPAADSHDTDEAALPRADPLSDRGRTVVERRRQDRGRRMLEPVGESMGALCTARRRALQQDEFLRVIRS